jgi:signal peptidase II
VTADLAARATSRSRLPWVALGVAAVVAAVDQATKAWAVAALADREPVGVIGDWLELRLTYNSGAAFSIGSGATWVFAAFAAVAVLVLLALSRRVRTRAWAVGVGLLLGGAATHLGDRLFREPGFARGHVVDFLDYGGWFVGNVADIALVTGVGLLLLMNLRGIPMAGRSG